MMKVVLKKAGEWIHKRKVAGEVVEAKLLNDDGSIALEGEWGVNEWGGVFIRSRTKNARLSNFSRIGKAGFEFDGVYVRGLEGFLQSVKFQDEELQRECCKLVGGKAFKFGRKMDGGRWKESQVVYWKGKPMEREGEEYAALIGRFFDAVYKENEENRNRLLLSGDLMLIHSNSSAHGDKKETILAHDEFIGNLVRVRNELMAEMGVEVVWEGEAPLVSEAPKVAPKEKVVKAKKEAPKAVKEKVVALTPLADGKSHEENLANAVVYVKKDLADGIPLVESLADAAHEFRVSQMEIRKAMA